MKRPREIVHMVRNRTEERLFRRWFPRQRLEPTLPGPPPPSDEIAVTGTGLLVLQERVRFMNGPPISNLMTGLVYFRNQYFRDDIQQNPPYRVRRMNKFRLLNKVINHLIRPQHKASGLERLSDMLQFSIGDFSTFVTALIMEAGYEVANRKVQYPYLESLDDRVQMIERLNVECAAPLGVRLHSLFEGTYYAILDNASDQVLGELTLSHSEPYASHFSVMGELSLARRLAAAIEQYRPEDEKLVIRQVYQRPPNVSCRIAVLSRTYEPVTELCYPYLHRPVAEMVAEFKDSSSRVLLLIGEPGTGKSAYINTLMRKFPVTSSDGAKNIYVVNSDQVVRSPDFINFLQEIPKGSLVICEDADAMVGRREEGNDIMAALLNMCSGVAASDIFLVLTTNLPTLNHCDPALIRPGRTFDILKFERLSPAQATQVREHYGMPPVEFPDRPLSLAEVWNWRTDQPHRKFQHRASMV